ncbi:MAG: hypothetical protein LLG05_18595 [Porphyromonadaceae bacterium]|nr:hypothetical protein [Porphyromonadaceae bacterium]
MNTREAKNEGLVEVGSGCYHDFWGGDKEKLKETIAKYRKNTKLELY